MNIGEQVLFAGQVVRISSIHNHATTGKPRFLVEHADRSFSKVGAESLAPLDPEQPIAQLPSLGGFHRQPAKVKRVLK